MITAGIDIGTDYTQAAIVGHGELLGLGETRTGFDLDDAFEGALAGALGAAELERGALDRILATGEGRKSVGADGHVTSYRVIGAALARTWPSARTVLLMGAKNSAALKLDGAGNVLDFDENDKCAAGVGRFLSDLTRYLDMDLEEMIEATLGADDAVEELNTQCSVFAESEVISLIHENVSEARIARAVHEGVAERNASLLRRVGIEEDVLVVGGVGRNAAFVRALREVAGVPVQVPDHPAHVAAIGAALTAGRAEERSIEADAEPGARKGERFGRSIA